MALVLGTNDQFMHNHPLKKLVDGQNSYICGGCGAPGIGSGYRCEPCNYNLHDYCATCPATLSTFMHKQHELNLFFPEPLDTRRHKRVCSVCSERAEGMLFGSNSCEFCVHPLCSQLPQYISHALHPEHRLRLEEILEPSPAAACSCLLCKELCTSYHYRCPACRVGVHFSCLLEVPAASPDQSSASISRSLQSGGYHPHSLPTSQPPLPEVYTPAGVYLPPPQPQPHSYSVYGNYNSPTIPPAYPPPPQPQPQPQPHSYSVYGNYNSPTIPPAGVYTPPPQPQPISCSVYGYNCPTIPPAEVYTQPPPQHHYGVYGYNSPTIPPAEVYTQPPPQHHYGVYGYNYPFNPPAPAQPHPQYGGYHYVPQQPPNHYNQVQNQCHANHENTNTPPAGGGGGQPFKPQESETSGGGGGGGSRIGKIIARIAGTMILGVTSSAIYDQLENIVC